MNILAGSPLSNWITRQAPFEPIDDCLQVRITGAEAAGEPVTAARGDGLAVGLTLYRQVYIHIVMSSNLRGSVASHALFPLPCACQNLRRLTRLVTKMYDQELRKAGIEITQYGLLTALGIVGEANQRTLSAGFAMDSTTLTRTLALMRKAGWIQVRAGKDRRERLFRLSEAGKERIATAQPHWEAAERRLRKVLGAGGWKQMQSAVARVTNAAAEV